MNIYEPKEDSFLLAEEVEKYLKKIKYKEINILDMGSGSGIQAETARKAGFKNILCCDINKEAVEAEKKKGLDAIQSNLFSKISRKEKFDLILFNPPYLPEDKYDKEKDTSGGKKGDETILRFIKQLKFHLKDKGRCLLLLSSLTPKNRILQELKKQKLCKKKLIEKNIFFENLEIWKIEK